MLEEVTWIGGAGWYHVLLFGLVIPYLAFRSAAKLRDRTLPLPDRLKHFRAAAITLVLFGTFSAFVARVERVDLWQRPLVGGFWAVSAAVAMYVVAVLLMRPRWRRAVERRARIVHLFMPSSSTERAWWVAVAILAGISEEITWRGVQPILVAHVVRQPLLAVLLVAVTFGLTHIVQGWKSAAIVSLFALGFQTIVWLSGSLYLAMLVHMAYDVTAGLSYGRLGRELGYSLELGTPAEI
jgi:membrane protease YdiL (CAAX protease family)